MTSPVIRSLFASELAPWLELRALLWPETPRDLLIAEQAEILADPQQFGVLVAADASSLVGFAEVSIRDWAEGCETRPVGYLEGWYVRPEVRRCGLGRRLLVAAENWAQARGCAEMASDAELDNQLSHDAHRALGFQEVLRVVLFSKRIGS